MFKQVPLYWSYSVISEKANNADIGEYNTYGIKVIDYDSTTILHDVSVCKEDVIFMAKLFNKYQLSAVHLQDSVEDMLS